MSADSAAPVSTAPPGAGPRRWRLLLPGAALVLLALCLRGPFAAVGPVVGELGDELSLSTAALSVVTSIPLVCFGLVSPLAPMLAARIGLHRAVLAAAVVVLAGIGLRLAGPVGLFAGTVLLTAGIAVANVLLPAVGRAEYGNRSAAVIGAITGSMSLSASLGAGLAQPLTDATGSALTALALWGLPALAATAALVALVRARPGRVDVPAAPGRRTAILRDRVALAVMAYFGLQSLGFYSMLTWLASVLRDEAGMSAVSAGGLVGVAALLGVPLSLLVPPLAARRPGQVPWVLAAAVPALAAPIGLLLAPDAAPVLWALLYGIGTGASFPLAMLLVLQRTRDAAQTGRLSAAAQAVGYLLAATGPLAVGLLHEASGGWEAGLVLLVAVTVLQVLAGIAAARPRLVSASA
ncbi:MFS transporter [Blastococcus sp. TF02A-30]|uniref:MFS transporter n=1 Tax=Blastococcus sp. TF02A-30 TaxID=2250580 RepID=UPI000DEB85EB|nr:MFS transporter [Blastococcus sp. TF02A-30]RBY84137.1 MFS transporter [Blastococcus sp. TF02A-30]